jgi:glycosyltransferase involved in cell wall biosynthesis
LLRKETAGWKCWIVGSGPEECRLRELTAELGLDEQVQFLGYREDVSKLLGLGDIFVLSSTNEGFGRALLEAMSARLAVVATTVGGIPTVLDNGAAGYMVPPGNPEALAEVLHPLVLSPEKRDKWASLALERVKTAFGLERMIEDHVKLYAALLNDL